MGSEICWNKAFAEQTLPGENSLWPDQWSSGNVGHQQWGTEMVVWESITLSDNGILSEWIFPKNKAWVLFILQDQNNNNGEKKKKTENSSRNVRLYCRSQLLHILFPPSGMPNVSDSLPTPQPPPCLTSAPMSVTPRACLSAVILPNHRETLYQDRSKHTSMLL